MCLHVGARGMPPQPHPPVAEGAWLRPRPARQSPDCRRGLPAQHIRSALSQGAAGGAAHVDACAPFGFDFAESPLRFAPAHFRLRRIPAGRRVRMRRGLPSPGSVGIPPVAGSAASRLPPSASPAVTASASCRRPSCPLRPSLARGKGEGRTLRAITNQRTHFAHCKGRGTRPAETDKCR